MGEITYMGASGRQAHMDRPDDGSFARDRLPTEKGRQNLMIAEAALSALLGGLPEAGAGRVLGRMKGLRSGATPAPESPVASAPTPALPSNARPTVPARGQAADVGVHPFMEGRGANLRPSLPRVHLSDIRPEDLLIESGLHPTFVGGLEDTALRDVPSLLRRLQPDPALDEPLVALGAAGLGSALAAGASYARKSREKEARDAARSPPIRAISSPKAKK